MMILGVGVFVTKELIRSSFSGSLRFDGRGDDSGVNRCRPNDKEKFIMKRIRQTILLALIFLVVFISHFVSRNVTSFDSAWSIHTAMSIIKEGNTNLDEY